MNDRERFAQDPYQFCDEQRILPVYINSRDRLSCLKKLVAWLEQIPYVQIIILDNESTYPPLLEWYKTIKHEILYLEKNCGHTALWMENKFSRGKQQIQFQRPGDWYVYTDPDIVPREDCPLDALRFFKWAMDNNPNFYKCGFGLEISDIPDYYHLRDLVRVWEKPFWEKKLPGGLFDAGLDTQFALYNKKRIGEQRTDLPPPHHGHVIFPSLRADYPYVARHTIWYVDYKNLTDEELYYIKHANYVASWTNYVRPLIQK